MIEGEKIGYIRVSSFGQNPQRQLDGLKLDKAFIDKASGKSIKRPQLDELLHYVREGDTVIVHSMDRLARNLDDLRQLVFGLTSRKVKIQFLKENLTFSGDDAPIATLLLSVMGSVAEFERSLIRERQLEGIALAKKNGLYKGRKKSLLLTQAEIKKLKNRLAAGETKAQLARELNVSRETLYKYLKSN